MARSHHPLLSHTFWGVDGWDDLSGHSWPGVGYMAWNSTERSIPYGCKLSFFLPAWKRVTLDQFVLEVIGQGYSLPFVRQPSLSRSPFGDSVTHPAVQMTSAVGSGFGPRGPCRLLICHGTRGKGGWWVTPILTWLLSALMGSAPFSTCVDIYLSCQVPHGDRHLYSAGSSQGLVDGVAGSQGHLFACANTPQSLAISFVCSQELGRGAHCLPMEGSPFWLSDCTQTSFASAGMSDASVHRGHLPCSRVRQPGSSHSGHQSPFSLQA